METIQNYIFNTSNNDKDNHFYSIVVFNYSIEKQDNKTALKIEFYKGPHYTTTLLLNYDAAYRYKSQIAAIDLLLIDAENNAQFNKAKLKKLELLESFTHTRKTSQTDFIKACKSITNCGAFNKDVELISKRLADAQNNLFAAYKEKLITEENAAKYKTFFSVLNTLRKRKQNTLIYLISRSLYQDKDGLAKAFLNDTKAFNEIEMKIAINMILEASQFSSFNYDKLRVLTHIRAINNKWKKREIYAKIYKQLYIKYLDIYKDANKAKQETLKAMPKNAVNAIKLLNELEQTTN